MLSSRTRATLLVSCAAAAAAALALPATASAATDDRATANAPLRGLDHPDAIDGKYIVVLKTAPSAGAQADQALDASVERAEDAGADVTREYGEAINGYAATMSDSEVKKAQQDPNVAYVEADRTITVEGTRSAPPWGLDRIDARTGLDNTITTQGDGTGATVYVIDTGIHNRSEFAGRMGTGYTAITDGVGTDDCAGHGTHVAGTVASTTHGVAPGARVVPVRVLGCDGSGSTSGVIAGVNWVTANHAANAVANMSLGGGVSTALDNAVNASIASGVTYVAAAGNSNADACGSSPARAPQVITVAATARTDAQATYSNWGTCVDLYAPGTSVTSLSKNDTGTASMSGTSMASPHVAGAAALYLQNHPGSTPAQVAAGLIADSTPNVVTSVRTGTPNRLLYVGSTGTTNPPVTTQPSTPTPSNTTAVPSTQPAVPTTVPAGSGCSATLKLDNSWSSGFQATVTITAGSKPITGWKAVFSLPGGASVGQLWNGTLSASGSSAVVTNTAWNGGLAAAASTTFGFTGTGAVPTSAVAVTCSPA